MSRRIEQSRPSTGMALALCAALLILTTLVLPAPAPAQEPMETQMESGSSEDQAQQADQTDQTEQEDQEEQDGEEDEDGEDTPEPETVSEEIFVTGSRIATSPLTQRAPMVELDEIDLKRTGATNLGRLLQNLPSMGSAINTRFNVPGNSGFPQDGTGIGAGAVQLSLRNLGAKRTLVLVDGRRWIAGASASGVPVAVDLNSVPANVIERIEVLKDGASAIYGSDAIGGVVNIITKKKVEGMHVGLQSGGYVSDGDGEADEASALWGGGNDTTHLVVSASHFDERGIETADRDQSAFPTPFGTSCLDGGCSSFTPQGRFVLGPEFGFADVTLNDNAINDGGANVPQFNPDNPGSGDFHEFTTGDRFNFNGPGFNFLLTPNERLNLYTEVTRELNRSARFRLKASYTNRKSETKGAPEPLCLGNGCGNRILENIVIDADQIYNPFGVDLSVADGTLEFFGRRPLESGPRIFQQDVDTYFGSLGAEGEIPTEDGGAYLWDVTASYGENRGFQQKFNSHNAARLAVALGDPAVCAATPNCVPFNFFGGQGPGGSGSITEEMLDFVGYTQRDYSEQTLLDVTANITGDLFKLPTGVVAFAAGAEYRDHEGSYQPDPVAASGETAGIPSAPTAGGFDVTEVYTEVSVPLVFARPGAEYVELNLAGRYSDYSTFGGEDTYKLGLLWQPTDTLSLRGSYSTGLRAPGIGELFGGAAREDFTFLDPCADVLGRIGSTNGGRDMPQSPEIIENCRRLGVPVDFAQRNPQLSAVSAGNEDLVPETSDNYSFGLVYGGDNWTFSVDAYDLEIEQAIQGRNPADVVQACVETLDPFFCDAVERTDTGLINLVDNRLQNIGGVEASGADFTFRWRSPLWRYGSLNVGVSATYLDNYTELTQNPDGSLNEIDRTGTITNETFQRAFPDWRALSSLDWSLNRYSAGLVLRYVDSMEQASGNTLDSRVFADIQGRYLLPFRDDAITLILGSNNFLDEDPAVCDSCGVIGMSPVVHDLPGRVVYARIEIDVN